MMDNSILERAFGSSEYSLSVFLALASSDSRFCSIVVAEPDHLSSESGEDSLAASSIVVPLAPSMEGATHVSTGLSVPSLTAPSAPLSDDGSFGSSPSLISMPSTAENENDEEDDEVYQDSRSRIATSPVAIERELEYVVLYDTSSSGDD